LFLNLYTRDMCFLLSPYVDIPAGKRVYLYLRSDIKRTLVCFISVPLQSPLAETTVRHKPNTRYDARNRSQIFAVLSSMKNLMCYKMFRLAELQTSHLLAASLL
jgi:hypothetical protein